MVWWVIGELVHRDVGTYELSARCGGLGSVLMNVNNLLTLTHFHLFQLDIN